MNTDDLDHFSIFIKSIYEINLNVSFPQQKLIARRKNTTENLTTEKFCWLIFLSNKFKASHERTRYFAQAMTISNPDESARAELRTNAWRLLTADLDRWQKFLETASPDQNEMISKTLAHWQRDSDLISIREATEFEKLLPTERERWEAHWKRVGEMKSQLDSHLEQ